MQPRILVVNGILPELMRLQNITCRHGNVCNTPASRCFGLHGICTDALSTCAKPHLYPVRGRTRIARVANQEHCCHRQLYHSLLRVSPWLRSKPAICCRSEVKSSLRLCNVSMNTTRSSNVVTYAAAEIVLRTSSGNSEGSSPLISAAMCPTTRLVSLFVEVIMSA